MNYGELKTEVGDWLNRSDLTTEIPRFIRLAETEIYRDLRTRDNEFTVTYDTNSTAGEHLLLPQNFRQVRRITWGGEVLKHISDTDIGVRLDTQVDTRLKYFTLIERQLVLSAAIDNDPAEWDEGSELSITYYGTESLDSLPIWQTPTNPVDSPVAEETVSALTQTDTNTTRLLQVAPDLYINGAMYNAYEYLQETKMADRWGQRFHAALASLKREHKRADFSGSTTTVNSAYGD